MPVNLMHPRVFPCWFIAGAELVAALMGGLVPEAAGQIAAFVAVAR